MPDPELWRRVERIERIVAVCEEILILGLAIYAARSLKITASVLADYAFGGKAGEIAGALTFCVVLLGVWIGCRRFTLRK